MSGPPPLQLEAPSSAVESWPARCSQTSARSAGTDSAEPDTCLLAREGAAGVEGPFAAACVAATQAADEEGVDDAEAGQEGLGSPPSFLASVRASEALEASAAIPSEVASLASSCGQGGLAA